MIQVDSRENKNQNILDYFEEVGQKYIVSKMISGDYQDVGSVKTLIDVKQSHNDGVAELCANLTRTANHERFKREIARAREIGCERFIVLIISKDITCIDEIHTWVNKRGQTNPATFEKIVRTFNEKYGVEFIFCQRKDAGKIIVSLITPPLAI